MILGVLNDMGNTFSWNMLLSIGPLMLRNVGVKVLKLRYWNSPGREQDSLLH